MKRIVVAITGASGVVIAKRLLEELKKLNKFELHLIISEGGKLVIAEELKNEDVTIEDFKSISDFYYEEDDLASSLSSSSFLVDSMVIIPSSMKTLSSIANGLAENLITRCAENLMKFNRKVVISPRDTPITLSSIENMKKARLAGAIILPLNVAFYYAPRTVDDIINFFIGKILDSLEIENKLYRRWEPKGTKKIK